MELHIRDVSKSYSNGVQALKDVTLTVPHTPSYTIVSIRLSPTEMDGIAAATPSPRRSTRGRLCASAR